MAMAGKHAMSIRTWGSFDKARDSPHCMPTTPSCAPPLPSMPSPYFLTPDPLLLLSHLPCSVKMGPGGLDALVALGAGDMRRSLNIIQSCHMAFDQVWESHLSRLCRITHNAHMPHLSFLHAHVSLLSLTLSLLSLLKVDEDAVYLCTGNPMPRDIEEAVRLLFNAPFNEAFESEWGRYGLPLSRFRWHMTSQIVAPLSPPSCICIHACTSVYIPHYTSSPMPLSTHSCPPFTPFQGSLRCRSTRASR